ncbi:MAG: hypothetical protein ACLRPW_02125 [Intestinibacter sp.]
MDLDLTLSRAGKNLQSNHNSIYIMYWTTTCNTKNGATTYEMGIAPILG